MNFLAWLCVQTWTSRGYGATAARLTPDQKVGSSNLWPHDYGLSVVVAVRLELLLSWAHVLQVEITKGRSKEPTISPTIIVVAAHSGTGAMVQRQRV